MKKLYILIVLYIPTYGVCIDSKKETEMQQVDSNADTDRAALNFDEDNFYDDMLDKMIEMGAVDEQAKPPVMPFWKKWVLRIGSSVFAKYDALKKFIAYRYYKAKKNIIALWSKAYKSNSETKNNEKHA